MKKENTLSSKVGHISWCTNEQLELSIKYQHKLKDCKRISVEIIKDDYL